MNDSVWAQQMKGASVKVSVSQAMCEGSKEYGHQSDRHEVFFSV